MKNAEKLKEGMRLGRVYRRQDLGGLTTAVDRDLKILHSRLSEFDEDKLRENLERFGRPAARAILKRVARERRERMPVRVVGKEDDRADLRYWLGRSPAERVDAVEVLREQYYALS